MATTKILKTYFRESKKDKSSLPALRAILMHMQERILLRILAEHPEWSKSKRKTKLIKESNG